MAAPTSRCKRLKESLANGEPSIHGPDPAERQGAPFPPLRTTLHSPESDRSAHSHEWRQGALIPVKLSKFAESLKRRFPLNRSRLALCANVATHEGFIYVPNADKRLMNQRSHCLLKRASGEFDSICCGQAPY